MTEMINEKFYNQKEVAAILRLSRKTISRYAKRKVDPLPFKNFGSVSTPKWRISETELKTWIEQLDDPSRDI